MSSPQPLTPLSHNISSPNTPMGQQRTLKGHPADETFSSIHPGAQIDRENHNAVNDMSHIENETVMGDSMAFSRIDKDFEAVRNDMGLDEDGDSMMGDDSYMHDPADDTNFSMVNADMTNFYNLLNKDSPAKSPPKSPVKNDENMRTPRANRRKSLEAGMTPRTVLRPKAASPDLLDMSSPRTPSPRRRGRDNNQTQNLLLDFTTQFEAFQNQSRRPMYSPTRNGAPRGPRANSPPKNGPQTPTHNRNLLDFEIPPAPTPRSIPSVTPREVELLKSEYLSQLASLKAEIRGKEAECKGLKEAVSDAEDRCGKARQEVEDLRSETQSFESEMSRLRELAKDLEGDLEREKMNSRELMKRFDQMRVENDELRTKNEELRSRPPTAGGESVQSPNTKDEVQKVAKELHALYKQKHENKVAALKKSYETRWENVVKDLEEKNKRLQNENESLRTEKEDFEQAARPAVPDNAHEIQMIKLELAKTQAALEAEKKDKGDLITMVEELLTLQPELATAIPATPRPEPPQTPQVEPERRREEQERRMETIRGSVGRARGLKPPGSFGASRIGRPREH